MVVAAPTVADGYDELLSRIDSASSVGASMVKTFNDQTELLRTMDRQMGASGLIDQMTGHLAALEDALNFSVLPSVRRPVAVALAGRRPSPRGRRLTWDRSNARGATTNLRSVLRATLRPMYLAHAMGEQAYVLCEAGRAALGLDLVRDAQRTLGQGGSPRLWAWLYAAEAELCAHAGRPDELPTRSRCGRGEYPAGV